MEEEDRLEPELLMQVKGYMTLQAAVAVKELNDRWGSSNLKQLDIMNRALVMLNALEQMKPGLVLTMEKPDKEEVILVCYARKKKGLARLLQIIRRERAI